MAQLTRFRWSVGLLLFAATTLNFLDRQILSILKPELSRTLQWTDADYGNMVAAFQAGYAIGFLWLGWLLDRIDVRHGYAGAITLWSGATITHGMISTVPQFIAARFVLGVAEAGNWPAVIKIVGRWFEQKDRSALIGLINSGSNLAALLAPVLVPVIAIHLGWAMAFYLIGSAGLLWLLFWYAFYNKPHEPVPDEDSSQTHAVISWWRFVGLRETLAFGIGKLLTDPVWWIYLYWLPDFLHRTHGLKITQMGLPLIVIYLMADIGSILGGYMTRVLVLRGYHIDRARKMTMLVCALCVLPVLAVPYLSELWSNVLLIGLACAAHQGWSANLFSLPADLFEQAHTGKVSGIGMAMGALGGILIAAATGRILQWTGSYWLIFMFTGTAYLIALALIQWLAPDLRQKRVMSEFSDRL